MNVLQLVLAGLRHQWRINLSVALGVAAATAVLTGALVIGDSVRGSLRHLVLDRLGKIDDLLVLDRFFRRGLADELGRKELQDKVVPAILFPAATVQSEGANGKRLAAGVFVIGSDESYWDLEDGKKRPAKSPKRGEVVINAPLAEELGSKVGDTLVVRFGKADQVPADSPLGRRSGQIATLAELKLIEIIPAEGLGRFGLQPSQISPRNAYVSLEDVQGSLDMQGRINAILLGNVPQYRNNRDDVAPLSDFLTPRLVDYGLALKHVNLTFGEGDNAETIFDYYSLSSERLLIEPAADRIASKALARLGAQPVLTYLANMIEKIGSQESVGRDQGPSGGIPYS